MLRTEINHRIDRWSKFFSLKAQGWNVSRWADIFSFPHRLEGYRKLNGIGIEVGAFNCPAALPPKCKVSYCDIQTKEKALELFPEIDSRRLVQVDHVMDIDKSGLSGISDKSQNFVVLNHVLEHVANPLYVLSEVFRDLKPQGVAVLSIPDKEYSFDKPRALTTFDHLFEEYKSKITDVSEEHYLDFVKAVYPKEFAAGEKAWRPQFEDAKKRHEHAHVWNSESFQVFLKKAFEEVLEVSASKLYQSVGKDNHYEYFSVWQLN